MQEWEKKQRRLQKEKMIMNYELEKNVVTTEGAENESSRTINTVKRHKKMNTQYKLDDVIQPGLPTESAIEADYDLFEQKNS